ncbi:MAG TPA: tyrosine-type recombinase/integrase [Amycolatopsis sp.]|nr:tyrosine-type recombinase/integrase [Amycolatopsis sp.]
MSQGGGSRKTRGQSGGSPRIAGPQATTSREVVSSDELLKAKPAPSGDPTGEAVGVPASRTAVPGGASPVGATSDATTSGATARHTPDGEAADGKAAARHAANGNAESGGAMDGDATDRHAERGEAAGGNATDGNATARHAAGDAERGTAADDEVTARHAGGDHATGGNAADRHAAAGEVAAGEARGGVTASTTAPAPASGDTAIGEVALWPGVPDPAGLLAAITDWLSGYGNRGTRRTYAEGLGLPVTANDLREWLSLAHPPSGWSAALARYAATLGIRAPADAANATPATNPGQHRPPPAARGPFRSLHWLRWCAARGQNPLAARSHHVKAWLDALADAGAAVATRDRLLATVKACYTHLADEGLIDANPAALNRRRLGLVAPAGNTSTTITLTTAQVAHLCEAAAAPRRGAGQVDTARARAVVTMLTLGLRVSELCDLDRADLHVTRGRRALRVHGKGGKTRIVYLHALADQALRDYLRVRDQQVPAGAALATRGAAKGPSAPLLVTRNGRRYQRQAIWQLLRRLAVTAGEPLRDVADALHPHALRHFYVTAAVEAGAQLVHVQADVGHTSIDTTEGVYNSAARDPGRSAVDLVAAALMENGDESP